MKTKQYEVYVTTPESEYIKGDTACIVDEEAGEFFIIHASLFKVSREQHTKRLQESGLLTYSKRNVATNVCAMTNQTLHEAITSGDLVHLETLEVGKDG